MIEKGDPIGEAAVLAMAGDPIAARRELGHHFEELGDALFELRHGFIHHVQLVIDRDADGASLPAVVRRVLSAPCCRFVDSIQFGLANPNGYDNSWAESLAALLEMPQAPHIRELRFNAYTLNDSEISWVGYGDLAFAWPKLPALELLHIRAGQDGNLGALELPNLHTFIRESGGLRRSVIESLCAMPRVSLRHLELWTGASNYGGEIQLEDVVAVMKSTPNLAHLGIVNSELSDDLLPMLAKSQLLPKLESLDLSRGIAAKTFTDYLVGNPAPYRHLAAFDLSENVLYDEEVEQIRAVLDNVLLADQRPDDREDDYEDDPGERYVALGE